ncbi:bud emergence protein 1 [Physocladia obscura]|uniref:Bud emergence protein 1 n=1 Tax=Physocladia obscura TaxID=109957 RepID=A0AAD5STD2_9FUNG|nr:bud emergence protein 1 [Physocladia obscura]
MKSSATINSSGPVNGGGRARAYSHGEAEARRAAAGRTRAVSPVYRQVINYQQPLQPQRIQQIQPVQQIPERTFRQTVDLGSNGRLRNGGLNQKNSDHSSTISKYTNPEIHSIYDTDAEYGGSVMGHDSLSRRLDEIALDEDDYSNMMDSAINHYAKAEITSARNLRLYAERPPKELQSIYEPAARKDDIYSVYQIKRDEDQFSVVDDSSTLTREERPQSESVYSQKEREDLHAAYEYFPRQDYDMLTNPKMTEAYSPASTMRDSLTTDRATSLQPSPRSTVSGGSTPVQRQNMANTNLRVPSSPFAIQTPSNPLQPQPMRRAASQPSDLFKIPPSKIVKAVQNYTARNSTELSFLAGDFFYVFNEDAVFFEVTNPAEKVTGFVPKSHFQSLEKSAQRFSADQRFAPNQLPGNNMGRVPFQATVRQELTPTNFQNGQSFRSSPSSGKTSPGSEDSQYSHHISRNPVPRTGNQLSNFSSRSPSANARRPSITGKSPIKPPTVLPAPPQSITKTSISPDESFRPPVRSVSRDRSSRRTAANNNARNNDNINQQGQTSIEIPLPRSPSQHRRSHLQRQQHQHPTQMKAIRIQSHRQFNNDQKYYYKIDYTPMYPGTIRNTIYRTHDDFWSLHVSLLNFFPIESGRGNQRRQIPFLHAPINSRDVTAVLAARLQLRLEAYLKDLIKLPEHILTSGAVVKFFSVRAVATAVGLDIENSGDAFEESSVVGSDDGKMARVQIVPGGAAPDTILYVPKVVKYGELLDQVEKRLGNRIAGLDYKDESGCMLQLYDDFDLGLLMRTNFDNLVFYPV